MCVCVCVHVHTIHVYAFVWICMLDVWLCVCVCTAVHTCRHLTLDLFLSVVEFLVLKKREMGKTVLENFPGQFRGNRF